MEKYKVELTYNEIMTLQVSLAESKKFKESLKVSKEEESDRTTGALAKSLNDSIEKYVKERDELSEKLSDIIHYPQTSKNSIEFLEENKLRELSNEELITRVMELTEINDSVEGLNEELTEVIEELRNTDAAQVSKVADFFTNYENIQRRYDYNNVNYQMQSVDDITKIFGITMSDIKGFSDLIKEDQVTFKEGILNYLNSWGLGNRVQHLPIKVWKEGIEFRFTTLGGNDREEYMNSEGDIL